MEEFCQGASTRRSLGSYREFLEDGYRLSLYRRAIRQVVQPGDIVADLGAGLGVLAALAVKSGARKVIAIDDSRLSSTGRAVVRSSGLDHRIIYASPRGRIGLARSKMDVLILETLGDCALEIVFPLPMYGLRRYVLGKPVTIPARIDVFAAPVRDPYFHGVIMAAFGVRSHGMSLKGAKVGATNRVYKKWIYSSDFLAPGRRIGQIDPARAVSRWLCGSRLRFLDGSRLTMSAEFPVTSGGMLTGFGLWTDVWFTRDLVAQTLSSRHWKNVFLPLEAPIAVERSDTISVSFSILESRRRVRWQWTGKVKRKLSWEAFSQGS